MIEGLPWSAQIGVAGLGWALLGVMLWGFITGRWLVSRREADTYVARAEKAESNVEQLVATVADLTAVSKLQKATIDAALKVSAAPPDSGESS